MKIDEIQDAFRFDMDMCLFEPFSGESESEEWYLERNKRNHNDMNVICYLAKKEAIELLEELKQLRFFYQEVMKSEDGYLATMCERTGYNKGVDDLVNLINEMPIYENEAGEIMPMPVEMMAERLKEQKNDKG